MAEPLVRLRVDSSEYDSKIKRAAQGVQHFVKSLHDNDEVIGRLLGDTRKYVESIGKMETVSTTAKGRLAELTAAFTDLRTVYNSLSDEEKKAKGGFGQELNKQLEILKGRITSTKQELTDINKELGNAEKTSLDLGSVLSTLGSKFGINSELMGTLTTGTIAYTAAIGAAATAVAYATKMWAEYNSELAKQQQITTVTTGLKGEDADKMTAAARAISKVYGTDFREVINAANTLMTQFGQTGDEAINLLKDGMQGMIQGDGGKLLSMIQQYAPAFRDAGVSASQLIAVIQNSEGGIFTAENMNAIVMGIKNIRLMTNATSEALSKLGIDGQQMSQDLSNGTITISDALKKVAESIDNVGSGSQAAGEVMQTVFGRQGAMAGTKLGEAIATLNLNLDETKTKTGEVGESLKRLTDQTEKFEKNLMDIAGFDGWDSMTNDIETGVLMSLNETLTQLKLILKELGGIAGIDLNATGMAKFFTDLATVAYQTVNPLLQIGQALLGVKELVDSLWGKPGGSKGNNNNLSPEMQRVYNLADHGTASDSLDEVVVTYTKPTKTPTTPKGGRGGGRTQPQSEEQLINQNITKLTNEFVTASKERQDAIREEIKVLQERAEEIKQMKGLALGTVKPRDITDLRNALDYVQGVKFEPKEFKVTANTEDALKAVQGIDGVTIDPKTLTITANTEDALKDLRDIEGLTLTPKKVEFQDALIPGQGILPTGIPVGLTDQIDKSVLVTPLEQMTDELKRLTELREDAMSSEEYQMRDKAVKEQEKKIKQYKGEQPKEDEKKTVKLNESIGSLAGGMSQMVSGMEQLGIEVPAGIHQAIGALQGISTILTGIATIVSTIEMLVGADALIPFALGGIVHAAGGYVVPGNHFSNDMIPAALSSGELVLNKSQQSTLASVLDGGGMMQNLRMEAVVSGEQIRFVLNNNGRRTGKGEYLQANFRP